jgi:hypothetical protein
MEVEFKSNFKNIAGEVHKDVHPYPIRSGGFPDWMKRMEKWHDSSGHDPFNTYGNQVKGLNMTIRACPAVIDSFTAKNTFIIPNWGAFMWRIEPPQLDEEGNPAPARIEIKASDMAWHFETGVHPLEQMGATAEKPPAKWAITQPVPGLPAIKLISPWMIKTPPGTSTLFLHPFFDSALPFKVLPGIVHTDLWHEINFPVIWDSPDYDGWVKHGIPMIQMFVFRREEFNKAKITYFESEEERDNLRQDYMFDYSFATRYKPVRAGVKWAKNLGKRRHRGGTGIDWKHGINPLTLIGKLCKILHRRK